MSKSYLLLILALIVAVLGVGGFALYRSNLRTSSSTSPTAPSIPFSVPNQTPVTNTPPISLQKMISLTVSSPTNGQTVSSPSLTVTGKTVPNADVAINDKDIKANAGGNFTTTLTLDEGDNDIFVTASDDTGNFSEWTGTVTYTPAQ